MVIAYDSWFNAQVPFLSERHKITYVNHDAIYQADEFTRFSDFYKSLSIWRCQPGCAHTEVFVLNLELTVVTGLLMFGWLMTGW